MMIPTNNPVRRYMRSSPHQQFEKKAVICFFCEEPEINGSTLHEVRTKKLDARVTQGAIYLLDQRLLAKLSEGDMIAIEAKYHDKCLASFYKRIDTESQKRRDAVCHDENTGYKQKAFVELLNHIQAILDKEETTPVFQLSNIKKLYCERIEQLGGDASNIHATRLKNKILDHFPQLEAHTEGREVLLICNEEIGRALKLTCEHDEESEALLLSKAANIIRKDLKKKESTNFKGSFEPGCQTKIPDSLITLVSMILYGTKIGNEADYSSQAGLSISQLLAYHFVKRRKKGALTTNHHPDDETPLPLFVGALIHLKTRSRDLIDSLYKLGLSVSYDRVLQVSTDLGNSIIEHYESLGAVCPPKMKIGVFTTSAVDNLDHNPTSTSAESAFHGTGISVYWAL